MSDTNSQREEYAVRLVPQTEQVKQELGEYKSRVVIPFDTHTPDGAKKLIQGQLDKLPNIKEIANKEIRVVTYMQHPAEKVQKDGQVKLFVRSVIYDDKGNAWDCGADGVYKAIELIKAIKGNPPWNPPIKATVIVQNLSDGKIWVVLRPDPDALFANQTTPVS